MRQTNIQAEAKRRRHNPNRTDKQHSITLLARGNAEINKPNGSNKYNFTDVKKLHMILERFHAAKLNHSSFVHAW
jgi:hypothetical protein